jgi:tetratricopeptide (TPR) repeat protein
MKKSNAIKICILIFFSYIIVFQLFAQDELIKNAENSYKKGNYKESINYYKTLIKKNYKSEKIYYNLANAYFKINDFGNAVLYYEKALKTAPNDKEVLKNLKVSRKKIDSPIEAIPEIIPIKFLRSISKVLSPDEWAVLALINIILVLILLFFKWIREKKINPVLLYSSLSLTILIIIFMFISNITANDNSFAVIFQKKRAFSAPSDKSEVLYEMPSGDKIKIIDSVGIWYEIELINKEKAWILKGNIERI